MPSVWRTIYHRDSYNYRVLASRRRYTLTQTRFINGPSIYYPAAPPLEAATPPPRTRSNKHTFQLKPSATWWMWLPFNFNYAAMLLLLLLRWSSKSRRLLRVVAQLQPADTQHAYNSAVTNTNTHTHTFEHIKKIRWGDLVLVWLHFSPSLVPLHAGSETNLEFSRISAAFQRRKSHNYCHFFFFFFFILVYRK